jgi:hypothetical protein
MADVSAHTPIFSRGSTVLDYWLAHAEGLTVQPLGARVEEVVVVAPVGRAESLVVRSRLTRRRRTIPADSIAAVAPSTGDLLLDAPQPRAPLRVPRPSPELIAAARAHAAGTVQRTQAGTRSAVAWTQPRAARAGETTARYGRLAAAGAAAGLAWLGPRIVEFGQLTLAGAVLVARGTVHATRQVERATVTGLGRGRASLEARRAARRQRTPGD